ncbi:MAG: helix-turn-helix transcriptional regulator [Spirochaetales bacterium]|nr:helix-turn-helix transcriptional regulator [Spirochaetales bacterium]
MYILFIIGFALNVCSFIMSFVFYKQNKDQAIRFLFILLLCELTLYCLYFMSVYLVMIKAPVDFAGECAWYLANYALGAALFYLLQRSFYRLLSVRYTMRKRFAHLGITVSMVAVYLVLVLLFRERWKDYILVLYHLTTFQFVVIGFLLGRYLGRIENRRLKSAMRIWLVILIVIVPFKIVGESGPDLAAFFDGFFGIRWPFLCLILVSTNAVMFRFLILELIKPTTLATPAFDKALFGGHDLTERELDVAELLIERRSYREIGERLFISIPTVKSHANHIYRKLNLGTRGELLELAEGLKK